MLCDEADELWLSGDESEDIIQGPVRVRSGIATDLGLDGAAVARET